MGRFKLEKILPDEYQVGNNMNKYKATPCNRYYFDRQLPSEFQKVEYLSCNDYEYLNIGERTMTSPNFDVKFSLSQLKQYGPHIISPQNNMLRFVPRQSGGCSVVLQSIETALDYPPEKNTIYRFTSNSSNIVTIDNITDGTTTSKSVSRGTTTRSDNFILLAYYSSPADILYSFNGNIYYIKLYDGDTIVSDLVPCYRKADNVIGMYDTVNDVFYTNAGTGTFNKGNDVSNYNIVKLNRYCLEKTSQASDSFNIIRIL